MDPTEQSSLGLTVAAVLHMHRLPLRVLVLIHITNLNPNALSDTACIVGFQITSSLQQQTLDKE